MSIAGPFYYITIAIANIKLIKIEASNPNDSILFAHKQGSATSFDILISLSKGIVIPFVFYQRPTTQPELSCHQLSSLLYRYPCQQSRKQLTQRTSPTPDEV
jgi:hypothetical protein